MPIDGPLMAIDGPHGTAMAAIDELRWDLSTGDYIRKSTRFDVFCFFCLLINFLPLTRISALFAAIALLPFLVALYITIFSMQFD